MLQPRYIFIFAPRASIVLICSAECQCILLDNTYIDVRTTLKICTSRTSVFSFSKNRASASRLHGHSSCKISIILYFNHLSFSPCVVDRGKFKYTFSRRDPVNPRGRREQPQPNKERGAVENSPFYLVQVCCIMCFVEGRGGPRRAAAGANSLNTFHERTSETSQPQPSKEEYRNTKHNTER